MEKNYKNNVNTDNLLHENGSRAVTVNESIIRIVRTYNTFLNGIIDIPSDVKALFLFAASPNGPTISMHLDKYKATFAIELIHLYKFKRQNVSDILTNLERIGLIEVVGNLNRGSGGRTSKVYALVGSDIDVLTKAQSRYRDIKNIGILVKNNLDQYREQDQIQHDYDEQLELDKQQSNRENIIGMLVTGYVASYETTEKPVCLRAIEKVLRTNNIDTKYVHSVAETLEKAGVLTTYTKRDGKPDPTWNPTPKILMIRSKRGNKNE